MRTVWIAGISVAVSVALVGCTAASPSVVEYHGDYPLYSSAKDLCAAANLVAVVTISGTDVRQVDVSGPPGTSAEEDPAFGSSDKPEPQLVIETIAKMKIETILKGTEQTGTSIEVGQPGGLYEDTLYKSDAMYEFRKDGRYLLFLATFENSVPANLVNPSQGPYLVDDKGNIAPVKGNDLWGSVSLDEVKTTCAVS